MVSNSIYQGIKLFSKFTPTFTYIYTVHIPPESTNHKTTIGLIIVPVDNRVLARVLLCSTTLNIKLLQSNIFPNK